MKLWKRIGLDNKSSPCIDELAEYSTIKVENKKDCNLDDFDVFEQFINPTLAKRISEEAICQEIESCESEVLDSGPPSLASPTRKQPKRFYQQDSKLNVETPGEDKRASFLYDSQKQRPVVHTNQFSKRRLQVQRIKSLKLQMIFLQEENSSLKKGVQLQFDTIRQEIVILTRQLQEKLARYEGIVGPCSKCENQKKMIDALTKQCCGVEEKLKERNSEIADLQVRLANSGRESVNPLRKVEQGLLQERGELVKRLKQELQLLQEENLSCRQIIEEKDNYLQQLENAYKSNLIDLKQEIQSINQACSEKIEQILQQKEEVQQELVETHRQFEILHQELEYLKKDQRMFSSMGHSPYQWQEYHQFHRKKAEQEKVKYSMISNSTKNLRLATLPHEEGIVRNYAKYPTSSMTQFGSPEVYNKESSLRSLSRENSDRDSPRAANVHNLKLRSKEKWMNQTFAKRKAPQTVNSIHSYRGGHNGSERNYEKALSSLQEIKKDVRREIRRSELAGR